MRHLLRGWGRVQRAAPARTLGPPQAAAGLPTLPPKVSGARPPALGRRPPPHGVFHTDPTWPPSCARYQQGTDAPGSSKGDRGIRTGCAAAEHGRSGGSHVKRALRPSPLESKPRQTCVEAKQLLVAGAERLQALVCLLKPTASSGPTSWAPAHQGTRVLTGTALTAQAPLHAPAPLTTINAAPADAGGSSLGQTGRGSPRSKMRSRVDILAIQAEGSPWGRLGHPGHQGRPDAQAWPPPGTRTRTLTHTRGPS